jgi:molecular chaperone IbpA
MLHKGIAKRMFSKSFTIAEDVEIKGAELKDGLLKVSLERIVPENKKPRIITVK